MPETAPKKFRLSFVNAAEDVPRLVRAYGRACDGGSPGVPSNPEAIEVVRDLIRRTVSDV